SNSVENIKLNRTMNKVEGAITRMNSMTARCTRSLREGLNVVSAEKAVCCWRCGRKIAGDPIQDVPGRNASAGWAGGDERQPMRQSSPISVPGGSIALLPMKERLPMWFLPMIMNPSRTRGAPSDTLSAMKLSSPIDNRSGEINDAVDISAPRPTLAPNSRYQGVR